MMKRVARFAVLFLLLAAATTGFLWFCHIQPGHSGDIVAGQPLARVVIVGEVPRNSPALTRYLRQPPVVRADIHTQVLAHYGAAFPTEQEKTRLKAAGISLVTLPFLALADLPYYVDTDGGSSKLTALQRELSVRDLSESGNSLTLLQFPQDISPEELSDELSETETSLLIVKFGPDELGEWDNRKFSNLARVAADSGARLVIGDHQQGLQPPEIYRHALIVPGLGYFLGGTGSQAGAYIVFTLYEEGFRVAVHPLTFTNGLPSAPRPWHFFSARQALENLKNNGLSRRGLTLSYVSPALTSKLSPEPAYPDRPSLGVAAAHPLAVEAGLAVLRAGGNAVDAAAAVSYVLAVVEPQGSGIGGGGIMLVHLAAENRQVVIDYRETAPALPPGTDPRKIMDWPSTGIPGFVRGLEKAVANFGTMEYSQIIEPAYKLARHGFPVSAELSRRISNNAAKLVRGEDARRDFFERGRPLAAGRILKQPALAATLQSIMAEGSDAFYEGEIAAALIATLAGEGLVLTHANLASYRPVIREPLQAGYRGYTVVTVPPPAGGFNLLQQLRIIENYPLPGPGAEAAYLLSQVLWATNSDRRSFIGDPSFVQVPLAELLGDDYIQEKLRQINSGDSTLSPDNGPHRPSDNTTHAVVVDAGGNWVSVTNSISYFFGYGLQAGGFFLNTQLNNFSSHPLSPNFYQPGKRPFSHISPTLLFKEQTPVLAIGTPGGRRIPAFLVQVIVRYTDFGETIEKAVAAPRFWAENRRIYVERGVAPETLSLFRSKGYTVITGKPDWFFGRVAALYLDPRTGQLSGTADPGRGEGAALVY